ncbi:MAG: hypothetical protein AAGM67_05400, partial [Bacteroidota bacterium]
QWGTNWPLSTGILLRNGELLDSFTTNASYAGDIQIRTITTEVTPLDVFQLCEEAEGIVNLQQVRLWADSTRSDGNPNFPRCSVGGMDSLCDSTSFRFM